jgi:mono/diheme cytochrome c family protein
MKTLKLIIIASLMTGFIMLLNSCNSTKNSLTKVKDTSVANNRSGAQLWGENCIRCHNIPSPSSYNDTDWETIGLHMKVRANLTNEQADKIFEFIKSAN